MSVPPATPAKKTTLPHDKPCCTDWRIARSITGPTATGRLPEASAARCSATYRRAPAAVVRSCTAQKTQTAPARLSRTICCTSPLWFGSSHLDRDARTRRPGTENERMSCHVAARWRAGPRRAARPRQATVPVRDLRSVRVRHPRPAGRLLCGRCVLCVVCVVHAASARRAGVASGPRLASSAAYDRAYLTRPERLPAVCRKEELSHEYS